jgi:hypothetical protein
VTYFTGAPKYFLGLGSPVSPGGLRLNITHGPTVSRARGARPFRLSDARCSWWCACGHAERKLQARGQDAGGDRGDARGQRVAAPDPQAAVGEPPQHEIAPKKWTVSEPKFLRFMKDRPLSPHKRRKSGHPKTTRRARSRHFHAPRSRLLLMNEAGRLFPHPISGRRIVPGAGGQLGPAARGWRTRLSTYLRSHSGAGLAAVSNEFCNRIEGKADIQKSRTSRGWGVSKCFQSVGIMTGRPRKFANRPEKRFRT